MILQFGCDMFMSQQSKQVQVYTSHLILYVYTQLINSDFKVIKTVAGESLKVDGNRHLNGMKML